MCGLIAMIQRWKYERQVEKLRKKYAELDITLQTIKEDRAARKAEILTSVYKYYKQMEKRNVSITLEKAKEWYKAGGDLREIALQAFKESELKSRDFTYVTSWQKACEVLGLCPAEINEKYSTLREIDEQLACLFLLKIILQAVNGPDWKANQQDTVHVPWLWSHKEKSDALKWVNEKPETRFYIGSYNVKNKVRYLTGGDCDSFYSFFGPYFSGYSVFGLVAYGAGVSLLACKTADIATHVSKYFGNLIMGVIHYEQYDGSNFNAPQN